MAVELKKGAHPLTVYNTYHSRRYRLMAGKLPTLASHTSLLVGGDFNADHPILQSLSPTNKAGRHLGALLDDIPDIHLLNTGEATHLTSRWCHET